jgi:hypothetical protein
MPLHPVKVGVWCAVSARRIVVPLFLTEELIVKDIYMYRDIIFNISCDLWIVTTSFQTLSAIRHADSLTKFVRALQPVVHRSPWNQSTRQKSFLYNTGQRILYNKNGKYFLS